MEEEEVPRAGLYSSSSSSDPEQKQASSFLAGFRDCRREVLRYLVTIEQVPFEGPVVVGLERHLTDLEAFMQQGRLGDATAAGVVGGSPEGCQTAEDASVAGLEHGEAVSESSFDSGFDSTLVGSTCADLSTDVIVQGSEEETLMTSRRRPDGEADDGRRRRADDTLIDDSELARNASELMHLANSDPRINRILNELFVLMDSDYYDDDDDDDDDGIEMEEDDGITLAGAVPPW